MINWRQFWRSLLTRLSQWWHNLWHKRTNNQVPSASQTQAIPLSYTHYEFLFHQLLEGVATEGWQQPDITQFFRQWQDRTRADEWFRWLERFGERVLASPSPNLELAKRMIQLGEVSQDSLATLARQIGLVLLERSRELEPPLEEVEPVVETPLPIAEPPKLPVVPPPVSYPVVELRPQKKPDSTPEIPVLNSLAGVLRLLQQRPQMVQQLARQMGMETTNAEEILRGLQVRALIKSSLKQQQRGNQRGAMEYVEQALALDPQYAIAWGIKGDILFQVKQFEKAIAAYHRATDLNPQDEQAWYNQGMTWFKLRKFEQALASFEQALSLEPSLHSAWKNKAISLLNLARYQECLDACDRALAIEPDDPTVQTCREKAKEQLL